MAVRINLRNLPAGRIIGIDRFMAILIRKADKTIADIVLIDNDIPQRILSTQKQIIGVVGIYRRVAPGVFDADHVSKRIILIFCYIPQGIRHGQPISSVVISIDGLPIDSTDLLDQLGLFIVFICGGVTCRVGFRDHVPVSVIGHLNDAAIRINLLDNTADCIVLIGCFGFQIILRGYGSAAGVVCRALAVAILIGDLYEPIFSIVLIGDGAAVRIGNGSQLHISGIRIPCCIAIRIGCAYLLSIGIIGVGNGMAQCVCYGENISFVVIGIRCAVAGRIRHRDRLPHIVIGIRHCIT